MFQEWRCVGVEASAALVDPAASLLSTPADPPPFASLSSPTMAATLPHDPAAEPVHSTPADNAKVEMKMKIRFASKNRKMSI